MKRANAKFAGVMAVATAAGIMLTGAADAAVITPYTSRATFEAAISNPQTFDFNQPNGPIATLGTELSISTAGGDASGQVYGNQLCGSVGGGVDCFPPVLFTFDQPGTAFGYDNMDLTSDEEAVVTLSFVNGDADQTFVFDLGGAAAFTPIFFGAVSDVDIASVQIYSRDPGSTLVGQRANVIDNVTISSTPVPEPATLGLLGITLAGFGFRTRRKAG